MNKLWKAISKTSNTEKVVPVLLFLGLTLLYLLIIMPSIVLTTILISGVLFFVIGVLVGVVDFVITTYKNYKESENE